MKNKLFILLAVLVLSFVMAAAVSAEEGFTFDVTEGFSFKEESGNVSIDLSIPQVSGMADEDAQKALNDHFLEKKDEIIAEYEQTAETAKEGDGPHAEYKYSWKVITDNDDHFVIWTTYFFAAGSAGEKNEFFNLDKKTGKLLDFDEDAVTSLEEMAKVREQIFTSMSNARLAGADFWTEGDALDVQLGQVRYLNHWYFNKDGKLVICFDEAEIAPASMGTRYFVIER